MLHLTSCEDPQRADMDSIPGLLKQQSFVVLMQTALGLQL